MAAIRRKIVVTLVTVLLLTGTPSTASPEQTAKDAEPCNCDVKTVFEKLQTARQRGERLSKRYNALSQQITAIHEQLMQAAMNAGRQPDAEADLAASVAWNAFSLVTDATLDYVDYGISASRAEAGETIKILDRDITLDLLGPVGRVGKGAGKRVIKKALPKGGKVAKTLSDAGASASGVAGTGLSEVATLLEEMEQTRQQIAEARSVENKAWKKLLGPDCRSALKDMSPQSTTDPLQTWNLDAALKEVAVPRSMTPRYTDRAIAEQFYDRGFLRSEHDRIRQTLDMTAELQKRVYRYRVVARQLQEGIDGDGGCPLCARIETLRAFAVLEQRLKALQIEWQQSHLALIRNIIGAQGDAARLIGGETRGVGSQVTASLYYKSAALGLSIFSATSGFGTALSVIDAVSEINRAIGDYIYKAPVAEEIKTDARFAMLYTEGLKSALDNRLEPLDRDITKSMAQRIDSIRNDDSIDECKLAVVRVTATRDGEVVFEHLQSKEDPRVSHPVGKGPLNLEIEFNTDMAINEDTKVEIVKLGPVTGGWHSARVWRGRVDVPGGDKLAELKGWREIHVTATARNWRELAPGADSWGPDLHQDAKIRFEAQRPHLDMVRIERNGKVVYANPGNTRESLSPGTYDVFLNFDRRMLELVPADIRLNELIEKHEVRSLDDRPTFGGTRQSIKISGNWVNAYNWKGTLEIPDDQTLQRLGDRVALSVQAASAEGRSIDGDDTTPGDQPDESNILLIGPKITVAGQVTTPDRTPVHAATINIEIDGSVYKTTSDDAGNYTVSLPASVPNMLIVIAGKQGFDTVSQTVKRSNFKKADIVLARSRGNVVQIDSRLHHLGDSNYSGQINSRFQNTNAEGTRYNITFELPKTAVPPFINNANLRMTIKGAETNNPVLVNGKRVGSLATSNNDGSARTMSLEFDADLLREGTNELVITAGKNDADDFDDIEFANLQLETGFNWDSVIADIKAAMETCKAVREFAKFGGATYKQKREVAEQAYRKAWQPAATHIASAGRQALPAELADLPSGEAIRCPPGAQTAAPRPADRITGEGDDGTAQTDTTQVEGPSVTGPADGTTYSPSTAAGTDNESVSGAPRQQPASASEPTDDSNLIAALEKAYANCVDMERYQKFGKRVFGKHSRAAREGYVIARKRLAEQRQLLRQQKGTDNDPELTTRLNAIESSLQAHPDAERITCPPTR